MARRALAPLGIPLILLKGAAFVASGLDAGRGRMIGDLDILVTGKACIDDEKRQELIDHVTKLPGLVDIIARGENKVSFRQCFSR